LGCQLKGMVAEVVVVVAGAQRQLLVQSRTRCLLGK
jgi:hypothetical protein